MTTPRPRGRDRTAAIPVTIVDACLRDGTGGSPTAVVAETPELRLDDESRRRIPELADTSHAVFVATRPGDGGTAVRFFTAEGELPACGHGTVAALAYLAEQTGAPTYQVALEAPGGRTLHGRAVRQGGLVQAEFDVGPVALREPSAQELGLLLPALGLPLVASARVATLGRPRLLVRVPSRGTVEALAPDLPALAQACRDLDLLGCYAYAAVPAGGPAARQRYVARMFAPAIGVPEDIANANSTACLAALQHASGGLVAGLAVDMGDRMGSPATISASIAAPAGTEPPLVRVGGTARVSAPRSGA
ncbi:PhzF family phenazine biosynthesis protein [Streptacidiphilus jiangxiensis]|uniref:Phenazine biosynthesis protein PhzF family n=1 Tax=Streptacidiphilus jiangxiensis TaxID=235985 RepID=A0A1H7MAB9_STRJI|nr:PhzF family phenazine biosynthesis protein [Streptacidiphilus jiangxiensis]SEL08071.1 phenazine biosynthesis protein PhzF family [Streptacidiphilus jiangxiensis]